MRQRTIGLILLLRCLLPYGGVVLVHEGLLRQEYEDSAATIAAQAEQRLSVEDPAAVARSTVAARNALKEEIRDEGNPITEKLAEDRNLEKYGDPLGPSYEQLYADFQADGLAPDQIDAAIVASAGRSNAAVNTGALVALLGGGALLLAYWAAVIVIIRRADRDRLRLAAREALSFVLAVTGGALGVLLLAPIDPLGGSSVDTIVLGGIGMLLISMPLVWLALRWPRSAR